MKAIPSTIYSGLPDLELCAMYRAEIWSTLDEFHRRDLLQETANRAARENGQKGACQVVFSDLPPYTAGEQGDDMIYLNREMYVHDRRQVNYKGTLHTAPMDCANLQALTTLLHENQHAYQEQLIQGEIQGDPQLCYEYTANGLTLVPIIQNDNLQIGSTYLQGTSEGVGYCLYRLQATERDAVRLSEKRVLEAVSALTEHYGDELSFAAYRQELAANGYEAYLVEAEQILGVPTPETQVNQSLMNHYYGTNIPVDPLIDALVSNEMIESYQDMMRQQEIRMETHTPLAAQGEAPKESGCMQADAKLEGAEWLELAAGDERPKVAEEAGPTKQTPAERQFNQKLNCGLE